MVEVRKKDGESSESLLRRFSKQVQQSRVLIKAKRRRFFEAPKNRRAMRENARRRSEIREHRDFLRKIGKLDDLMDRRGGRRPAKRPQ